VWTLRSEDQNGKAVIVLTEDQAQRIKALLAAGEAVDAPPDLAGRLRALIEQWRKDAKHIHARTGEDAYDYGQEHMLDRCADDLSAALADRVGAPPPSDYAALAKNIARDLFVNGSGQYAQRLVLTRDTPTHQDLGGWSEEAMADRIEDLLDQAVSEGSLRAPHAQERKTP
jgi:hypothetical protein